MRTMNRMRRFAVPAIALAGALWIAGCSKINQGNYDKVQNGETQQQVEADLGTGVDQPATANIGPISLTTTAVKIVRYGSADKNITVTYAGGKVIDKKKNGF